MMSNRFGLNDETEIDIATAIQSLEERERLSDEVVDAKREEVRQAIFDAAHNQDAPRRYVVEGARVVCTSMLDYEDDGRSESRMRKLTEEERESNLAKIEDRINMCLVENSTPLPPDRQIQRAKGSPRITPSAPRIHRPGTGIPLANTRFNINDVSDLEIPDFIHPADRNVVAWIQSRRLLDHLDIKFSPLFGEHLVGEDEAYPESNEENSMTDQIGGAIVSAGLLNAQVLGATAGANGVTKAGVMAESKLAKAKAFLKSQPRGRCKIAGDCKPEIEDLMWQGIEENEDKAGLVSVGRYKAFLTNSAYMFCTHGQGILYLTDCGQHLNEVADILGLNGMDEDEELRERRSQFKIAIDPGHGGTDPGAPGRVRMNGGPSGMDEKDLVLDISLTVQSALEVAGFQVYMIRTDDSFVHCNTRVSRARDASVDAFVSIHFNSSGSGAEGYETFYAQPRTQDIPFTTIVHNAVFNALQPAVRSDRGVKDDTLTHHQYIAVLRQPYELAHDYPRALLEIQFIDNEEAMNRLNEDWAGYRNSIAQALVNSLTEYFITSEFNIED